VRGPRTSRRAALKALVVAPLVTLAAGAEARDYGSAAEVFAEIDRLEAELDARMAALSTAVAAARPLARSMRADHDRHRLARAGSRRRLRLAVAAPAVAAAAAPAGAPPLTIAALTALAQDLVHAHAEGLPAVRDAAAVDLLAHHMVDDARHLAVLQMWAEAEQAGG
jgi:hypothetical protein